MTTHLFRSAQQQVAENTLVKHLAGSKAYGTSLPTSDTDFRGVFVADPIYVRTPFFRCEEVSDETEEDTKTYELAQFMKLAVACNPNVIETLWVDQSDIVFEHEAYKLLRAAAPRLLTKQIAFTTSGYALAQLKRIKGHNKWINNPMPEARPRMVEFMSLVQHLTTGQPIMPREFDMQQYQRGWRLIPYGKDVFGLIREDGRESYNEHTGDLNDDVDLGMRSEYASPEFIIKYNREQHEDQKTKHANFWTWKRNRNVVRNLLEQQHGYDTKHAMHLVRLMRMGYEALTEGVIKVKRPDAQELLTIRDGAWSYEQLIEYADQMDYTIKTLAQTTQLPSKPDTKFAASLVMDIQDIMWNK